ncbi:MAG: phosphoribosylformylglycinamidine cyclo-ligase, partial [Persicimonas sp.]
MSNSDEDSTSYRDAGVDLEAADETVSRLGDLVESTRIPGVVSDLQGFGALFDLGAAGFGDDSDTMLVAGTDGVGTKLELAFRLDEHDTIGIDCVAMCVNDVVTTGARPLFFLDYFATGKLRPDQAESVVRGVAEGCRRSGCALIGGETAEMPGFYDAGEYEIAGFCVGAVGREQVLRPEDVRTGDTIVGVASSGVHSNGFSLVRKIIADAGLELEKRYAELDGERSLGEILLEPTRIYASLVADLMGELPVTGLAHITGGGFFENLPRALPAGLGATIDASAWERPAIFDFIARHGNVQREEMYRVFNMGIGLAVIVRGAPGPVIAAAEARGFDAWTVGEVVE